MRRIFFFLVPGIYFGACRPPAPVPVNEKRFFDLGGNAQYVEMTGSSDKNPVLFFIHGGPGWPQTPYLRYFNAELTRHFILVSWDQAGCGQSYLKQPQPKNLSLEQLISDAHELTGILREKFGQKKIYLAGFSWGSIIGLHLADRFPSDYEAYFGISQVINPVQNGKLSRQWLREQALARQDTAVLRVVNGMDRNDSTVCGRPIDCLLKLSDLLSKYHGTIFRSESDSAIEKVFTSYEDYRNYDWLAGFLSSAYPLEKDLYETDFTTLRKVQIPVYLFLGRHDHIVPPEISAAFLQELSCPGKEIIWFEQSGHEPLEEEADRFNQMIIKKAGVK